MRVCYFGTYERDYPRNRIIIEGLRGNGVEVVECHYPLWERESNKTGKYLAFPNLLMLFFRALAGYVYLSYRYFRLGSFDLVMVGYIGQLDLLWVKLLNLFHRKPVVFNPLISLYDTLVMDRGIYTKGSIPGKALYHLDKWSMQLADLVILDTNAHIEYIADLFALNRKKFLRVFVGADETVFYRREDRPREDGLFRVLFFGKFIPLHGIHHILHVAKELEHNREIRFQIIGRGQLSKEIHKLADKLQLRNVDFIEWVDYEDLPQYIHDAQVCLGIFGESEKARRVIPNKVFQCLAMEKPVVTSLSPAALELLASEQNSILCEPPFPKAIKESIELLKGNTILRQRLAVNGSKLFQENLNSVRLVSELAHVLRSQRGDRFCEAPH